MFGSKHSWHSNQDFPFILFIRFDPFCIASARIPPTTPAPLTPTGQPICPQQGQAAVMAYKPANPNHQPIKRNTGAINGYRLLKYNHRSLLTSLSDTRSGGLRTMNDSS